MFIIVIINLIQAYAENGNWLMCFNIFSLLYASLKAKMSMSFARNLQVYSNIN